MKTDILTYLIVALALSFPVYASDDHDGHEEKSDRTHISAESAGMMNIEILEAGPAIIHQTVRLTGRIMMNQNKVARIRARFPGIVRRIDKTVTDSVQKGETLATVEGNESLQAYPITSPLEGIVLERNANVGDIVDAEPIFVIADLSTLWVEFFIFARDIEHIKPGQKMAIRIPDEKMHAETVLDSLFPIAESSSQTVIARATLDNADHKWRVGMTVRGDVVLSEKKVPLAVKTSALQRHEGKTVIYIRQGDDYEMRGVEIGESDPEWTEILGGIETGETYVARNSFVVKADLAKSEAEHAH